MKKNTILFITLTAFICLLTGCGEKTPITAEKFETTMTDKYGYIVSDEKEERTDYEYINTAYAAVNPNYVDYYCPDGSMLDEDDKCYSLAEDGTFAVDENGNAIQVNYEKVVYDPDYQLEYYIFDTVESAKENYASNKATSQGEAEADDEQSEVSEKNYSKYVLDTGEYYIVVSRIDNTIIYLRVLESQKTTVNTILSGFGY